MANIILVVEDEQPLAAVIKKKLENNNFEAVTTRTIDQALTYLEELKDVRAIWLDHYLLGKKNGLDLVTKLKNTDSKWKDIPIFVVSNTASEDKVNSYLQLGINKYYIKANYSLTEIVADIQEALKKTKKK